MRIVGTTPAVDKGSESMPLDGNDRQQMDTWWWPVGMHMCMMCHIEFGADILYFLMLNILHYFHLFLRTLSDVTKDLVHH